MLTPSPLRPCVQPSCSNPGTACVTCCTSALSHGHAGAARCALNPCTLAPAAGSTSTSIAETRQLLFLQGTLAFSKLSAANANLWPVFRHLAVTNRDCGRLYALHCNAALCAECNLHPSPLTVCCSMYTTHLQSSRFRTLFAFLFLLTTYLLRHPYCQFHFHFRGAVDTGRC